MKRSEFDTICRIIEEQILALYEVPPVFQDILISEISYELENTLDIVDDVNPTKEVMS